VQKKYQRISGEEFTLTEEQEKFKEALLQCIREDDTLVCKIVDKVKQSINEELKDVKEVAELEKQHISYKRKKDQVNFEKDAKKIKEEDE